MHQAADVQERLEHAVEGVRNWGESRDWRGYDPYDGLNSPLAPVLTLGTSLGRRLLTQVVKRSPLNLRPVLAVRPGWNAKALAIVGSAYARLTAAGDTSAREAAIRWIRMLADDGPGWGYHFDVQTRFFRYTSGTPNTIASSFVAQTFLDGYELLGDDRSGEEALGAARFLVDRMRAIGKSGPYFRYLEREDEVVHNANFLACAVLARTARCLHVSELAEVAAEAAASSLRAQRDDGSWPYAAGEGRDWVDNFHTGYVLESLAECEAVALGVSDQLTRGLDYWERELFLADGTPKYYSDRTLPLDAHNYAQAIETWLAVADRRPGALASAERTADLLIAGFLASDGHVRFQRGRVLTNSVPFVRWTTAPTFRAFARLVLARAKGTSVTAAGNRKESGAHLD
jgi:hypothetical protein